LPNTTDADFGTKQIARQISAHGGKVVVMGRREQFLKDAVQALQREGIEVSCCVGDVRSRESAEAAVAFTVSTYGSLNILVNSKSGRLARLSMLCNCTSHLSLKLALNKTLTNI
jgi:NADP-dependent 3-hydroxy acid dehydrogenase YdfG